MFRLRDAKKKIIVTLVGGGGALNFVGRFKDKEGAILA